MEYNRILYIVGLLLLFSCNREDEHTPLVADFELASPRFIVGEAIQISEVTLGALEYNWDFGNGKTSNVQFPQEVTYEQAGIYTISLTIISMGGNQSTTQREIIIGQHHAYKIELQRVLGDYRGRDMDIYFSANRIVTMRDEEIIEEEIYDSEVLSGFNSENLPIAWEVQNFPLGGNGYEITENPRIRFFDLVNGDIIAQSGYNVHAGTIQRYDPETQEGEFTFGQTAGATIQVFFRPVYP